MSTEELVRRINVLEKHVKLLTDRVAILEGKENTEEEKNMTALEFVTLMLNEDSHYFDEYIPSEIRKKINENRSDEHIYTRYIRTRKEYCAWLEEHCWLKLNELIECFCESQRIPPV